MEGSIEYFIYIFMKIKEKKEKINEFKVNFEPKRVCVDSSRGRLSGTV